MPEAFLALHRLRAAGLLVVPVTGRPAGWVDQIARLWPVDAVVGENGGLWFWMTDQGLERRFFQSPVLRRQNRERLLELGSLILAKVPGAALASDQPYRELDLAIDFCEDVPRLNQRAVDQIVMHFTAAGATSKVSSIHVNGWYGDFDKLAGCSRLLTERWGLNMATESKRWAYMGDSANDEPMFEHFDLSIGVANVASFLPRMSSWPKYICQSPGGTGFAEAVDVLLHHQAVSP